MIRDYIQDFSNENGIISSNQHEYMKKVFLDFAKAFDTVPLKRSLYKIRSIGIDHRMSTWIENWLQGRVQRVVINGECIAWTIRATPKSAKCNVQTTIKINI